MSMRWSDRPGLSGLCWMSRAVTLVCVLFLRSQAVEGFVKWRR